MRELTRDGTVGLVWRDHTFFLRRGLPTRTNCSTRWPIPLTCRGRLLKTGKREQQEKAPPPPTLLFVIIVDSQVQRIIVLATTTEETTVTQEVSHRPIKRQSRLWSQRGTKVNGSHHGDNPLLRPTGIQIVTESYATLHAINSTDQ